MAFPQTRRDIQVELFVAGAWTDISGDVYTRDKIVITRGAQDETSRAQPCRAQLTLDNRTGNYSPRNPAGVYYGTLGRNTPLRIAVGKDSDTFTRSVSSGWGTTSGAGSTWSTFSAGGTLLASDFNVGGTTATHSVPAAGAYRATYLGGQAYGDVDVAITCSLALASVTGGAVGPANLLVRGVDANNFLYAGVTVDPATGHYFITPQQQISGVTTAMPTTATVDTGISYSNGQQIRVRAQTEGQMLRIKLWVAASGEPYGWNVTGKILTTPAVGWVGVMSLVLAGNTNTKPIVFTYDNLTVRIPRVAVEVSSWPQRWDTSGRDIYAPIEGSGIKRRMSQGTVPTESAFHSQVIDTTNVVGYWPMEDGSTATSFASALSNAEPASLVGTAKPASDTTFLCSAPLPALKAGSVSAYVPAFASSGGFQIQLLMHIPSGGFTDNSSLFAAFTNTGLVFELRYRTTDGLEFIVFSGGTIVYDSGTFAPFGMLDTPVLFTISGVQSGGNVTTRFSTLGVGSTSSLGVNGTATGVTLGTVYNVTIDAYRTLNGLGFGHLTVINTTSPNDFTLSFGLNGFSGPPEIGGETANNRIGALSGINGIPLGWQGNENDTAMMGAQRVLNLLELLEEASDADMGILHEGRGNLELFYRTRKSLYNQTAALTLDYSAHQLAEPFEPIDDDQFTRNDILATRTNGSSFELYLSSGTLSVADPWSGGVGVYADQPTLNVDYDTQLPDIAGWRLLLGTVDQSRYPAITVNLANQNVVNAGVDNAAMSTNVGDLLVVNNPKSGQDPNQIRQIVRGYVETLAQFEHTLQFICAPASPYDVLRLDTASMDKLDSGTSTLSASITSGATAMTVAFTDIRWVTGSVSIDLRIGGERLTVINISGTTSPQTFTVTRSVNGVVAAHASGSAVTLWRPATLGL